MYPLGSALLGFHTSTLAAPMVGYTSAAPTRLVLRELLRGIERRGQCQNADLWRVQRYRFVYCPHLYILHNFIL